MADWADIANLWWLKQQPQPSSSLPAFELGARMQQQRIQNDIETKKMALDQQYRIDQLKAQDRLTDVRLKDYELRAREKQDEEDDFLKLNSILGPMKENKDYQEPDWKSYRGREAYQQMLREFRFQDHERALNNLTRSQQGKMLEDLGKLKDLEPEAFAALSQEYSEKKMFSPESIGTIRSLLNKHSVPGQTPLPEGWTTKRQRMQLPNGSIIEIGPETNQRLSRLPKPTQDIVNDFVNLEAKRLQSLGRPVDYDKLINDGVAYAETLQTKTGTPKQEKLGPPAPPRKTLTPEQALEFLKQSNGDRKKAEDLARQAGY